MIVAHAPPDDSLQFIHCGGLSLQPLAAHQLSLPMHRKTIDMMHITHAYWYIRTEATQYENNPEY
jgi:hypothetical protein